MPWLLSDRLLRFHFVHCPFVLCKTCYIEPTLFTVFHNQRIPTGWIKPADTVGPLLVLYEMMQHLRVFIACEATWGLHTADVLDVPLAAEEISAIPDLIKAKIAERSAA